MTRREGILSVETDHLEHYTANQNDTVGQRAFWMLRKTNRVFLVRLSLNGDSYIWQIRTPKENCQVIKYDVQFSKMAAF